MNTSLSDLLLWYSNADLTELTESDYADLNAILLSISHSEAAAKLSEAVSLCKQGKPVSATVAITETVLLLTGLSSCHAGTLVELMELVA